MKKSGMDETFWMSELLYSINGSFGGSETLLLRALPTSDYAKVCEPLRAWLAPSSLAGGRTKYIRQLLR